MKQGERNEEVRRELVDAVARAIPVTTHFPLPLHQVVRSERFGRAGRLP
jgi:hypothetical protein